MGAGLNFEDILPASGGDVEVSLSISTSIPSNSIYYFWLPKSLVSDATIYDTGWPLAHPRTWPARLVSAHSRPVQERRGASFHKKLLLPLQLAFPTI